MDAAIKPQTMAERVIWYTIVLTYPMYLLGLVFPVNTTLPWILLINVAMRFWQQSDDTPPADRVRIPAIVGLWVVAMLIVLVAILVGLTDFNNDIREIIRSSLNWCREWALYPICLILGICLRIRPPVIYRAVCNLCAQSLVMIGVGIAAFVLKVPDLIYDSPIERLTQNGKLFYEVRLYVIDVDSGGLRFTLFAPWAPALGLVACIYFLLALQESHRGWKTIGLVGATAMILASLSRGAFLFLPATMLLIWVWVSANRAYLQLVLSALLFWGTLFSFTVMQAWENAIDGFVGARKSSSQLREVIQRLSLDRTADAPIWGHGKEIPGPQVLKKMPLGSHHTWIGLLFKHGIVGFAAVLIPVVATLVVLAIRAKADRLARIALAIMLVVLFTSMGESMEKLAYLFWPALVLVGMALRPAPQS